MTNPIRFIISKLRRGASYLTGRMVVAHLRTLLGQRTSRNPLPGLTPMQVIRLYEAWREGRYADVQLAWAALEEHDDILGMVVDKRTGALKQMSWSIKTDAEAIGESAELKLLAEQQQRTLSEAYARVGNLSQAIGWLGMAAFRGYTALEPVDYGDEMGVRMELIDHWMLARPERNGRWLYNPDASPYHYRLEEIDTSRLIIHEVERPIDIPVMALICAKIHAIDGWDGFIDVYGNPAMFFEYPPGTDDDRAKDYNEMMNHILSEGRGCYASGGKITTVETTAKGGETFQNRADWIDRKILIRSTGGFLTATAESGTGTLAGEAHEDSFRALAASDASAITETLNRQYSDAILSRHYPGQPKLAYWSLEHRENKDVSTQVANIVQLAQAGYRVDDEAVSEITGLPVSSANLDPQLLYPLRGIGMRPEQDDLARRVGMPLEPIPANLLPGGGDPAATNRVQNALPAPAEQPLSPGEIAAMLAMAKAPLDPAAISKEADAAQAALKGAIASATANDPPRK